MISKIFNTIYKSFNKTNYNYITNNKIKYKILKFNVQK